MSADRRDAPHHPLPVEFWQWTREQQVEWVALNEHRAGLISKLLLEGDWELDIEEISRNYYLTEKDLAAIYCRILELKHQR